MTSDRTVHAHYPGMDIVRYNRAGKWYLEPTDPLAKRQHVTLRDAVNQAVWASMFGGGQVFFGRPGGGAFDREVARRAS